MIRSIFLIVVLCLAVDAQTEVLTNQDVVGLSRAGLAADVIVRKIQTSRKAFDLRSEKLIDLKQSGVADIVIAAMLEKNEAALPTEPEKPKVAELPPSGLAPPVHSNNREALAVAKTISFSKSSRHPSTKALEKELMKRDDFRRLNLTILRYKQQADLLVEISFVHGSVITHRYVYRVYDRRSGTVVAAGETTSWGSLAENLARHISKRLTIARAA